MRNRRLPEGCGKENSYLLGTLLVSKFQQLAMARQSQKAASRRDFWLHIDEFDHFITPSMAKILSGVRKYRLGLTLAHQSLHQLHSDPKVESAVLTQPCARIVFKVGDDDAKKLGEGFESFDARSLKNLEKFHAIARVERNDFDFNLALRKPELPDGDEAQERREKIIAASRAKYATPRTDVEAALLARVRGNTPPAPPSQSPVILPPAEVPKAAVPPVAETQKPTGSEKESVPVVTVAKAPEQIAKPLIAEGVKPEDAGHRHREALNLKYGVCRKELPPGLCLSHEKPVAVFMFTDIIRFN